MEDIIIRGLLADSTVKIMAISGKTLVEQARETHGLSRVCTAALGRTLMMTSMMGAQLKNADERVTAMLKGGGEAGNIVCTADWTGRVKGYVENPDLELPPAPNGKLDVALAVGWFGDLTVIRDMGLKEPYVGTCPIQSGEIAEDFARYFTVSEQQPSLVYLGVRVDAESGAVRAASGLLAHQLRPMKRGSQRAYRAKDILIARRIRELLYGDGYRIDAAREILNKEDREAKAGASAPQLPETSFPGFEGAGTFSQPEIDWEEFDSVVYNLEKIEEFLHN